MIKGMTLLLSLSYSVIAFAKQTEYIVKLAPSAVTNEARVFGKDWDVVDMHKDGSIYLVRQKNTKSLVQSLSSLSHNPQVEYVVENFKLHAFEKPNDPRYGEQWALNKIKAEKAWVSNKGSHDTVVAVIDTGVDEKHEDLKEQIWTNRKEIPGNGVDDDNNGYVDDVHGWDFFANDNSPLDELGQNPGHGTHCAGIIGATGNNGLGISGISQAVTLMPIRFLGADGSGDLMAGIKAIDYAVANGAQIISASWGAAVSREQAKPLVEAIQRAEQQGVLFVAAAANDGKSNDVREVFPANAGLSNVISVAASDDKDMKPSWSNYGKHTVDLAAPGHQILSTVPNNEYKILSGTSMATPLAAGLASLILGHAKSIGRDLNPTEIKAIMQASGTTVEIETACQCRIDAEKALEFVNKNLLTLVPNAATVDVNQTLQFQGLGGEGPYTFETTNPQIATVTEDGTLTAVAQGEVTIKIKDSQGKEASSKTVYIGRKASAPGGQCPFQNPALCDIMCQYDPSLPWCE